jgi:nicotinamidase-related amidase
MAGTATDMNGNHMKQCAAKKTALVLIDLQEGIVGMPWHPRTGSQVVAAAAATAKQFKAANALVVLVKVAFSLNYADLPPQEVDSPLLLPPDGLPQNWDALDDALVPYADIVLTKRQWGAFHGTELDLQLRRRGITNIVLGGIATNFGVESTARQAWELGYNLAIAEDLCASFSEELHDMAISSIFPHIARITKSKDLWCW